MKQNIFKSIAIALVAVAMLVAGKSAKAAIVGVGLGYDFGRDLIAVDFLIPLAPQDAKRPQGGVVNLGLRIGGFSDAGSQEEEKWLSLAVPVAYEHVFENGISIITGAEFRYYNSEITTKQPIYNNELIIRTVTIQAGFSSLGGGIVLGSDYFFESGVFLGLRIAAGVVSGKTDTGSYTNIRGYATPTLSVGYMF